MPTEPIEKLSEKGLASPLDAHARVVVYTPPQYEADPAQRVKTAPLAALAAQLSPLLGSGNAARIPLKVVATYDDLLALDPLTCCFGTEAVVLLPAPGEAPRYVLKYVNHAFAWAYVCQDGNFDQNPSKLSDGQWIAVDSPRAALLDYTEYPAGYDFPTGTFVAAYVAGQSTEQLFKRRAPGGPASAPVDGGDPTEWELASLTDAPPPHPASFQALAGNPRDSVALADVLAEYATLLLLDNRIPAPPATGGPYTLTALGGVVSWQAGATTPPPTESASIDTVTAS